MALPDALGGATVIRGRLGAWTPTPRPHAGAVVVQTMHASGGVPGTVRQAAKGVAELLGCPLSGG